MTLIAGQHGDFDIENRLMDMVGWEKEGESGTNGESNTETLPCVKYMTNGNLLYDSGNSNQGSITT